MRIIPDDEKAHRIEKQDVGGFMYCLDSGIEITDAGWDEILVAYCDAYYSAYNKFEVPFSQYLRELISLAGEGKV